MRVRQVVANLLVAVPVEAPQERTRGFRTTHEKPDPILVAELEAQPTPNEWGRWRRRFNCSSVHCGASIL